MSLFHQLAIDSESRVEYCQFFLTFHKLLLEQALTIDCDFYSDLLLSDEELSMNSFDYFIICPLTEEILGDFVEGN